MYYEIEDEVGNISTLQLRERQEEEEIEVHKSGDIAPLFYLKPDEGFQITSISGSNESRSLIELLRSRPVVLSFYCTCWGSYAPKHLRMLQEIAPKIEALGGQLVVLSNESPKHIERLSKKLDTELAIYHDRDRNVARTYGVYSETSPIWDRIAGISEEVFTPSLFVIGKDRRISYAFVDENFDHSPDVKTILKEVYTWRNKK
ncbi:alkyl hydroperoxide reductase [Dyadobacter luteus]|uniref:Alkyl hydroperoxide reductase n=1 Tax=Dyadobacter luteus TaxID=2259619 RepID=A0A3D8Y3W7_9BACT|nr:redoxin domain-containing protein [Dyadobacter luteus]REA56877.1 alkyl hydroperoxide reductase [Dyadobacter luteus]